MGGLCKSDTETVPVQQTTTQQTNLPAWVESGGRELFTQAKKLAQEEYQPYSGARVAPLSGLQQQAMTVGQQQVGGFRPELQRATELTEQGARQWSPEVAEQYMNPFQQQVTDRTVDELNRKMDIQRLREGDRARMQGAFGGARHGVQESLTEEARARAIGDTLLQSNMLGYENARNAFGQDAGRALSAGGQMGSLGGIEAQLGSGDVNQLLQLGGLQRDVDQANRGTAYQDFREQRQWPYEQLNFALGALGGIPYSQETIQTGDTQQVVQQPSMLGQATGALGSLYGGYKTFFG